MADWQWAAASLRAPDPNPQLCVWNLIEPNGMVGGGEEEYRQFVNCCASSQACIECCFPSHEISKYCKCILSMFRTLFGSCLVNDSSAKLSKVQNFITIWPFPSLRGRVCLKRGAPIFLLSGHGGAADCSVPSVLSSLDL